MVCVESYHAEHKHSDQELGPLVRINPDELHLNDPYFYERLYGSSGEKRKKDKHRTVIAGAPYSMTATVDHELHRQRRGYVAHFFFKQSIVQLERIVQAKVDRLVQNLREAYHNGETVVGVQAFGALTTDIITHYAYGESFGCLDLPGLSCPLLRDVSALLFSSHFRNFFPVVTNMMQRLPERLIEVLSPSMSGLFALQRRIKHMSLDALALRHSEDWSPNGKTIFTSLTNPQIPEMERPLDRLTDESQ